MEKKPAGQKKPKFNFQQLIAVLFYVLIGAVCGMFAVQHIDMLFEKNEFTLPGLLLVYAGLIIFIYLAIVIQIVIHESGHLVFGLLTGYSFSSFRIFSFMWLKEDGKIRLRRLSLAGTGGQCLMVPPDLKDGKIPFALYNLGGSMMNLIASLIFLLLSFLFPAVSVFATFLKILTVVGFAFALMNAVPLRLNMTDNDGRNVLSMLRDPEAVRAFWLQMKVNELLSRGKRIGELPEEWFTPVSDEGLRNSIRVVPAILNCNRLMELRQFEEADREMVRILDIGAISGAHRCLMTCDRIFIELIGPNRPDELALLLTPEQKKYMKAMKALPVIPRTEYVLALLRDRDSEKARKAMESFDKIAAKYPYPVDIESERALMTMAEEKAAAQPVTE